MAAKPGLYANIQKKRKRIAKGSGEKMRAPGSKGAPTREDFRQAAKTEKKPKATKRAAAKPRKKTAAAAKRKATAKK